LRVRIEGRDEKCCKATVAREVGKERKGRKKEKEEGATEVSKAGECRRIFTIQTRRPFYSNRRAVKHVGMQ
jgi:hypothetical protein